MTDMANLPARARSPYSEAQVEQALLTLIYCAGNSVTASAMLAEEGIDIPDATLRRWRTRDERQRYLELHEKHAQEIERHAIQGLRDAIPQMQAINALALENTKRQLEAGEGDPSQVFQRISVGLGIHFDKLRIMTDRPTVITETHSGEEALRNLVARGRVVDATLIEDQDEDVSCTDTNV